MVFIINDLFMACAIASTQYSSIFPLHDDIKTCKCFLHYQPFVRGIHWPVVDSTHKGPVMQSFDFSLLAWTNLWTISPIADGLMSLSYLAHPRLQQLPAASGPSFPPSSPAGQGCGSYGWGPWGATLSDLEVGRRDQTWPRHRDPRVDHGHQMDCG